MIELAIDKRYVMPKIGGKKLYSMIKGDLEELQIKLGRDKFFEILRENGMMKKRRKSRKRTTNSNHSFRKYPNLIKKLKINGKLQVLVSDITYIAVGAKYGYLNLITDAYTKKIVGYYLSESLEASGSVIALKMALKQIGGAKELIHHSDRGIQYCSKEYVEILKKQNIRISMTESGSPYDNAIAERVNGILKQEFMLGKNCATIEEARKQVAEAIAIYNEIRPHLSCGMLTPNQAHVSGVELKKMWKTYPHRWTRKINDKIELSTN